MIEIIRVATGEQIQMTANLAAGIWQEHYTPIIGEKQVAYMIDRFQSIKAITNQIDTGELVYFMLYLNRKPEGYFAIAVRSDEVFLSKLYIRAAMRKHGLAKRAIDFIRGVAADNCLKRISLTVNKNNHLAIASYKKMGFETHGTAVTDIGGGFVMDDYLLSLNLK